MTKTLKEAAHWMLLVFVMNDETHPSHDMVVAAHDVRLALAAHDAREAEALGLLKRAARFIEEHPCEELPLCDKTLREDLACELARRTGGAK